MGIWQYKDSAPKAGLAKGKLRSIANSHNCIYCRTPLERITSESREADYSTWGGGNGVLWGGEERNIELKQCQICGWWRVSKKETIYYAETQSATDYHGAFGSLKELDIENIEIPINEIKQFLIARPSSRFEVHPKLFEDVVGSVFRDIGWDVLVTGYSNDGGIDCILCKESETIGVQVKRYRNAIKVEQIRSLAGALLLKGMTKGIFVTTSDYQSGAQETANLYSARGYSIELMNWENFYEALKITRKKFGLSTRICGYILARAVSQVHDRRRLPPF